MPDKRSPRKIVTEACLVEAAAQLFARRGFAATTTREIAQLAGLNEVTLFRYFPRKPDLFLAALELHLGRIRLCRELQLCLAADDDPAVVVPQIVTFVFNALVMHPELKHLLHVAGLEVPEAGKTIRDHLGPIIDVLCAYFKRGAARGAIGKMEPSMATFGCIGAVAAHQIFRGLFLSDPSIRWDSQEAIASYASLCLHGMVPASASATQ
jgi:AcrR family transcriptional regulator